MITLSEYLMGRQLANPISDIQEADAIDLLEKVNALLLDFYHRNPGVAKRKLTSGYRPAEFNTKAGGASKSKHMACQAIDLGDSDRLLARWIKFHPEKLIEFDLYCESTEHTKDWVHFQLVPPRSGKRIFIP